MPNVANKNAEGNAYIRSLGNPEAESGTVLLEGYVYGIQPNYEPHVLSEYGIYLVEYECPEPTGGGSSRTFPTTGQLFPRGE